MIVRCMICGKKEEVNQEHPKWDEIAGKEKVLTYICLTCAAKLQYEANDNLKVPKPM